MQALVFDGARVRYDPAYPDPCPPPGEALVRVTAAGICSTDLEILRGYMSFRGVLGHEFVGVVEAAPDPAWVGRRVVGEINAACGTCPTCRAGRPTHCPQRTTLGISGRDGAFARYLTLPLTNLHVAPEEVTDAAAIFTEPLAAALEVLQQVHLPPTARVAVLGAGRLGQLLARVLRLTGCELVVWARYPAQAARLRRLGVDVRESPDYPAAWADVVIEATGRPEGFMAARRLVCPRHLSWVDAGRSQRPGGGRGDPGRLALRSVPSCPAPAGERVGAGGGFDRCGVSSGCRRGRAGPRGATRDAQGVDPHAGPVRLGIA